MGWQTAFAEFMRESSGDGEWVYRGQPARFPSIVPSLMREHNRWMHGNKLASFEARVAKALSAGSPHYDLDRIHPGLHPSDEIGMLPNGTPNTTLSTIAPNELIRALAQHYDFPTFLLDVSFSPAVAAFFATHELKDGRYVATEDIGVVYRWPVVRRSPSRLTIPGAGIGVIDLQPTAASFMRPHQQKAAVAVPVTRSMDLFAPETLVEAGHASPFVTPISDLELVDLAELSSCRRFELPVGAAGELRAQLGVSQAALFPDVVDFGFSYFAMATFLSMAIHEPGYFGPDPRHDALLAGVYQRGIAAGRSILDREFLRLRGGALVARPALTLVETRGEIDVLAEGARKAVQLMIAMDDDQDPEMLRHRKRLARETYTVASKRHRALRRAVKDDPGLAGLALPPRPRQRDFVLQHSPGATVWAPAELDRRVAALARVLDFADTLPLHLLTAAPAGAGHTAAFDADPEREAEVLATLAAARDWLSSPAATLRWD